MDLSLILNYNIPQILYREFLSAIYTCRKICSTKTGILWQWSSWCVRIQCLFIILEGGLWVFFLLFRKYSENTDCKKDGFVACGTTGMAVQIPAQVFIGCLGQLFYLPCISQFHPYKQEITFVSQRGNALILVTYRIL